MQLNVLPSNLYTSAPSHMIYDITCKHSISNITLYFTHKSLSYPNVASDYVMDTDSQPKDLEPEDLEPKDLSL